MVSYARLCTSVALASAALLLRAHGLKGSDDVYESVSSKVSTLAAQLSEMELANKQAMAKKKVDYESAVAEAKKKNVAAEAANVELEQEIETLGKGNAEKRQKADVLRKYIASLQADFDYLNSNFSTSLEFAEMTMKDLGRGMGDTSLKVLEELERRDEQAKEAQQRKLRLDRVAKSGHTIGARRGGLALLQTGDNPHTFLSALNGDLQDLSDQHKEELAALRASYAGTLRGLKDEGDALARKKVVLIVERDRLANLASRLDEAVKFLEKVSDALESKARSLRMFAARIGIRPVPQGHRLPADVPPAGGVTDMSSSFLPAAESKGTP